MALIDISTLPAQELGSWQATQIPANTYFVDTEQRAVFSKKSGELGRIFGTIKGGRRWFAFMVKNPTRFTKTLSLREDRLMQAAAVNRVKSQPVQAKASGSAQSGHGWLIGGYRDDGSVGFSQTPHLHTTESSVDAEIERLAKLSPGKRFIKVRIEAIVQAGGVSWT